MKPSIKRAADVLLGGGVIAYPTEGVFGLGCLPDDSEAVLRLLDIKQRDPAKGLILIAAEPSQFEGWIAAEDLAKLPAAEPANPVTWISRPGPKVTPVISGIHTGLAVRLAGNATAIAICNAVELPLTSTSANLAGHPVVRNKIALRRTFGGLVDYIVPGDCGPSAGPSEIRNLENGQVLRPGTR